MSAVELDFGGDFLNHSTRATGSGFLRAWKEDGSIRVWIHPHAPIFSLWSHRFFREIVETKGDSEPTRKIVGMRVNCLEKESLLKKQKFRDRNTGERDMPPQVCPHCKMVEWVRAEIEAGRLEWSDVVFKFDSEDGETDIVLHAGGICGLFQIPKDKMSKDELAQLRKAGVKQNEAYKENMYARQQYVMCVVSESDIDSGWAIAMEGATLGDKLRKTIADEVKRCDGDVEKGHPKYNPYPFEWSFDDNKKFEDKYDVVALTRTQPKGAIAELLAESANNIPDVSRVTAEPYLGTLKQLMMKHAVIDMPFDEFFEDAFEHFGEKFEPSKDEDAGEEKETERKPAQKSPSSKASAPAEEEDNDSDQMVECDNCDQMLKPDEMECPKCHSLYEVPEGSEFPVVVSRGCANPDCDETRVPTETGKCPKCGAQHDEKWNFELPKKKATRSSKR